MQVLLLFGILDRIVNSLKMKPTKQVRVNRGLGEILGTVNSNLRPDLVVIDAAKKTVDIIDVTMPFENRYAAFEEARLEKKRKYAGIAQGFEGKGFTVFLDAFIVGPLGGWDPRNDVVLCHLGIGRNYSSLMRKLMCSDAIKWSRDIYVEHMTGSKQYDFNVPQPRQQEEEVTP